MKKAPTPMNNKMGISLATVKTFTTDAPEETPRRFTQVRKVTEACDALLNPERLQSGNQAGEYKGKAIREGRPRNDRDAAGHPPHFKSCEIPEGLTHVQVGTSRGLESASHLCKTQGDQEAQRPGEEQGEQRRWPHQFGCTAGSEKIPCPMTPFRPRQTTENSVRSCLSPVFVSI